MYVVIHSIYSKEDYNLKALNFSIFSIRLLNFSSSILELVAKSKNTGYMLFLVVEGLQYRYQNRGSRDQGPMSRVESRGARDALEGIL